MPVRYNSFWHSLLTSWTHTDTLRLAARSNITTLVWPISPTRLGGDKCHSEVKVPKGKRESTTQRQCTQRQSPFPLANINSSQVLLTRCSKVGHVQAQPTASEGQGVTPHRGPASQAWRQHLHTHIHTEAGAQGVSQKGLMLSAAAAASASMKRVSPDSSSQATQQQHPAAWGRPDYSTSYWLQMHTHTHPAPT